MNELLQQQLILDVSENAMTAYVCLPSFEVTGEYSAEDVIDIIKLKGVKLGILEDNISDAIKKREFGELILVAEGKEPIPGRDGYYEFLFNTSPDGKPKRLPDGSVDYYNINLIEGVSEGQELARYIPKLNGSGGYNIGGKILMPPPMRELPPLRGRGFEISEDGLSYKALYDGKVVLDMGRLDVKSIYMVTSDVDLSTGNINFKGDLDIMGDIKSGMEVKATGNITVGGLVEDAIIEAGKNVLVRRGFIGAGKGKIKAGGNVMAQFYENCDVHADGNINGDYAINCELTAETDIVIKGRNGSIVGGRYKAGRLIRAKEIGSPIAAKTIIAVGIDDMTIINKKKIEEDIIEAEEKIEKIEQALALMDGKEGPMVEMNRIPLIRTKIDTTAFVFRYKEILEKLIHRITIGQGATVVAEKRIYIGTDIMIDNLKLVIDDELEEIEFKRQGLKILTKKYNPEDFPN